ncbi:MAG: polyprenyl diphosphate synthase, partial [Pseudomonadota bacterium]
LMLLLRKFIGDELPTLKREGVRVTIIGDKKNLDAEIKLLVSHAERETADNSAFFLQIAFNYGGRDEIVRAAKKLAEDVAAGRIKSGAIDEALFSKALDTAAIPDPDFVIRTSGEKRISNFLLWQAAYAEWVFLDVLWPDFDAAHFAAAIADFNARERRFGGVGAAS